MTKQVCVFVEPGYQFSALYAKSLSGLEKGAAKLGLSLQLRGSETDFGQGSRPEAAIILSKRTDWTGFLVGRLRALGVKSVLVGTRPDEFGGDVSGPTLDRQSLVRDMVSYFIHAGRRRLACYGSEPLDYNDTTRRDAFLAAAASWGLDTTEDDVFMMVRDLNQCADRFLEKAAAYDGVICVSDIAAIHLIARAKLRGIRVPEDLFVAGSGDFVLGSFISPSLTTTTLDYQRMGQLGMEIWRLLGDHPSMERAVLTLPCSIIVRQSTASAPPPSQKAAVPPAADLPDIQPDPDHRFLQSLENLLLHSDALDLGILEQVARGASIPAIANRLFMSPGTVNYRLKRIYPALGMVDKHSLELALKPYFSETGLPG